MKEYYEILNDMQIKLMKDFCKEQLNDWDYSVLENHVTLIYKKILALKIPKPLFVLDTEKIFDRKMPISCADIVERISADCKKVLTVDCERNLPDKITARIYKADNFECGVNTRYIKMLECNGLQAYGKNANNPIALKYGDETFAVLFTLRQ